MEVKGGLSKAAIAAASVVAIPTIISECSSSSTSLANRAVNELLVGDRSLVGAWEKSIYSTFHLSSGCEGPARATGTLILDWVHVSKISDRVVNAGGNFGKVLKPSTFSLVFINDILDRFDGILHVLIALSSILDISDSILNFLLVVVSHDVVRLTSASRLASSKKTSLHLSVSLIGKLVKL